MELKLLAKDRKYGELTLEQHLIDTEKAVLAIFQGRILKNWCRFFKVEDSDIFLRHLQIAALFHDIGKANADFLGLVNGNNNKQKQTLRHEWISALVLHLPTVRQWLQTSKLDLDLEVITAAVLCHHLKASMSPKGSIDAFGFPRTSAKEIKLYLKDEQVTNILEKIVQLAHIDDTLDISKLPEKWNLEAQFWLNIYSDVKRTSNDFEYELNDEPERLSFLLAVKAGLIAADSVASAMFRVKDLENAENWHSENQRLIQEWVKKTLHQPPITSKEIDTKILKPRYKQIGIKEDDLRDFQQEATNLGKKFPRLLLLSGCGSGKTIFAYKWQQGVIKQQEVGRVIFLYPTRGTATEGFKDYVSWAPEAEASLLTGTAAYELKDMQENPSESLKDKDFTTEERLYALGFWGKRFFSATVDQFLSFLTHSYSGMCLLPVLADSVLIVDEVHSFPKDVFKNLMSFLENFDIPVLCMTATLPKERRTQLINKALTLFPSENSSKYQDLDQSESLDRYHINPIIDKETAYKKVIEALTNKEIKRVLWVVNSVRRCREIAYQLEHDPNLQGIRVLNYHSYFTLDDRKKRHQDTIKAFAFTDKKGKERVIAVTTQVCEMSLNLDADVLISELAPISALIQRFGRSNRYGKINYSEIWVYEPPSIRPYKKNQFDLKKTKEFIEVVSGIVNQKTLAKQLDKYSPTEKPPRGESSFIEGGYWAASEPFRDADNYSVSGILYRDLNTIKKIIKSDIKAIQILVLMSIYFLNNWLLIESLRILKIIEKETLIDGFILPIPCPHKNRDKYLKKVESPDWLPRYLKIADDHFYHPTFGFGEELKND